MPIDSSRNRVGRHARFQQSVPYRPEPRKPRPGVFRVFGQRRQQHQSCQPRRRAALGRRCDGRDLGYRRAEFRVFQRKVDLDQDVDRSAGFAGGLVDAVQQINAVDGVNCMGRARRFPSLVRLQVADQMPVQPVIG